LNGDIRSFLARISVVLSAHVLLSVAIDVSPGDAPVFVSAGRSIPLEDLVDSWLVTGQCVSALFMFSMMPLADDLVYQFSFH
jgi:hypothetical protein